MTDQQLAALTDEERCWLQQVRDLGGSDDTLSMRLAARLADERIAHRGTRLTPPEGARGLIERVCQHASRGVQKPKKAQDECRNIYRAMSWYLDHWAPQEGDTAPLEEV